MIKFIKNFPENRMKTEKGRKLPLGGGVAMFQGGKNKMEIGVL